MLTRNILAITACYFLLTDDGVVRGAIYFVRGVMVIFLKSLWITAHLAFSLVIFNKYIRFMGVAFSFLLVFLLYSYKEPTYDLLNYLLYFSLPYPYEPLFWLGSIALKEFFNLTPEMVLFFWQAIIFIVSTCVVKANINKSVFFSLLIVALSLFVFLGSQNVLRQGLATSFILCAFFCLKNNSIARFIFFGLVACGFHSSSPLFLAVIFVWTRSYKFRLQQYHGIYASTLKYSGFFGGVGFGSALALFLYVFFSGSVYFDQGADWGSERSSSAAKIVAVLISFLISELILYKRSYGHLSDYYRDFRVFLIGFLLSLSIFPEFFARILFFYYSVEMLHIACLLSTRLLRAKLAVITIYLGYSFAPNVLNIISGQ